MTARSVRRALAPFASAALTLALVACSGGVSDDVPFPRIVVGSEADACGSSSNAVQIDLSDVGTRLVENSPAVPPATRLQVVGTVTGLPATDSLWLAVLPLSGTCPYDNSAGATVAADGSFTAILDIATYTRFRVVALSAATPVIPSCDTAQDCIQVTGLSGLSNTLEIRLQ
jgi:hypothetical protein